MRTNRTSRRKATAKVSADAPKTVGAIAGLLLETLRNTDKLSLHDRHTDRICHALYAAFRLGFAAGQEVRS